MAAQVLILIGSDSDLPAVRPALETLREFGIPFDINVSSAHRTPERTRRLVAEAEAAGAKVIIAAAGGAAHLAGVVAAETTLPVIGVPLDSSPLAGIDALLATAQMPSGIPVATMAVGEWGAANAGVLAARILALSDDRLRSALAEHRERMDRRIEQKAERLRRSLDK